MFTGMSAIQYFKRYVCISWVGLVCILTPIVVCAQTSEHSETERQVKAAYLYKFGAYIEWPSNAFPATDSPLRIGIIGSSELADELSQAVVGRMINGRQIVVRKLKPGDSAAGFNMLFIASSSNDRQAEILASMRSQPILTITESKDGLAQGSIINFVIVDGRLRFEVSSKAATQGGLNISARLLVAAYKVISG